MSVASGVANCARGYLLDWWFSFEVPRSGRGCRTGRTNMRYPSYRFLCDERNNLRLSTSFNKCNDRTSYFLFTLSLVLRALCNLNGQNKYFKIRRICVLYVTNSMILLTFLRCVHVRYNSSTKDRCRTCNGRNACPEEGVFMERTLNNMN